MFSALHDRRAVLCCLALQSAPERASRARGGDLRSRRDCRELPRLQMARRVARSAPRLSSALPSFGSASLRPRAQGWQAVPHRGRHRLARDLSPAGAGRVREARPKSPSAPFKHVVRLSAASEALGDGVVCSGVRPQEQFAFLNPPIAKANVKRSGCHGCRISRPDSPGA